MKQTDWKIIYSRYSGAAKRAVNLLSKEAGQFLIREEGAYCIYVLPCEREGCTLKKNNFIIGIYEESFTLRQYLSSDEVPAKGFAVKIMPNPQDPEGRLVLLAAHKDQELYYAAVHFLDDYVTQNGPLYGTGGMIFDSRCPNIFTARSRTMRLAVSLPGDIPSAITETILIIWHVQNSTN